MAQEKIYNEIVTEIKELDKKNYEFYNLDDWSPLFWQNYYI